MTESRDGTSKKSSHQSRAVKRPLTLYRQAQMLLAQGLDIKRAILAFWVGYAAAELKPLYLRLRELILASGKIAVDETVAPVLDPGRGRTKKGYFWAIARDDRPVPPTRPLPTRLAARRSRSPSVGRICAGPSSTSPKAAARRSPAKLSSASRRSMRSRRQSEDKAPASVVPCARRRASLSCSSSKRGSNNNSRASLASP